MNSSKFHSIKTELVLWFLLLSILPICIIAIFSYHQAHNSLTKAAKAQLVQSAELNIRYIKNWFDYRFIDITSMANDPTNVRLLEKLIQGHKLSHLTVNKYIKTNDWKKYVKTNAVHLNNIIHYYNYIDDFLIIDDQLNTLYSINLVEKFGDILLSDSLKNTPLRHAVENSLKTGKTTFAYSQNMTSASGKAYPYLLSPIINKNSQHIGVIVMQISLDSIFEYVNQQQNNAISHYILAEKKLLYKGSSKSMNKVFEKFNVSSFTPNKQSDNKTISIRNRIILPGINWLLISEIRETKALALAMWLGDVMIYSVIIIIFFVAILSYYIARRFTQPIEQLANATHDISNDNLNYNIEIKQKNEIGRLAESFNQMILKRRLNQHSIDQSNQKITQTLKSLAENKERFNLAMSVANDGVWDWDIKNNQLTFDARFYTMAGYRENEYPAEFAELKKRIHANDFKAALKTFEEYINGNTLKLEMEFRMRKKDTSYMWILSRGEFVAYDNQGNPIRMVGTHSDISKRKQTEKALQSAQKMEAVGQLTGGIAHDFNNILGIIIGNLDLLESQFHKDKKALKRINSASKATQRATKLTKQLLVFSRKKVTESKTTNINRIIINMDDVLRHSIGHHHEINYLFHDSLWLTDIDQGDLQDALLNLIINAKDAMHENGVLTIKTSNQLLNKEFCLDNAGAIDGKYIELSVHDNGCGINVKNQAKIFEPFFTTKEQGKGTGLGLSMVFGFVKRSGGYIKLISEINSGTTFRLYFPVSLKNIEYLSPPLSKNKTDRILQGDESILVVDDEQGLLELAQATLTHYGYQVYTATNAAEALQILLKVSDISLLFSDVVMSYDINGFELAIKTQQLYPKIKILLTSGYTGKACPIDDPDDSNFTLLQKPYDQNEMTKRIRNLLDS